MAMLESVFSRIIRVIKHLRIKWPKKSLAIWEGFHQIKIC